MKNSKLFVFLFLTLSFVITETYAIKIEPQAGEPENTGIVVSELSNGVPRDGISDHVLLGLVVNNTIDNNVVASTNTVQEEAQEEHEEGEEQEEDPDEPEEDDNDNKPRTGTRVFTKKRAQRKRTIPKPYVRKPCATKLTPKFPCDTCTNKFRTPYDLDAHKRSHTGERPFKCEICERGFAQKNNLIRHMETHSNKKFACKFCRKSYKRKDATMRHETQCAGPGTCETFECNTCQKKFPYHSNLIIHERSHTGKKLFKCKFCKRRFVQKSNRNSHMIRHAGEI